MIEHIKVIKDIKVTKVLIDVVIEHIKVTKDLEVIKVLMLDIKLLIKV